MPPKPELAITIGLEFFLAGAAFLIGGPRVAAVVAVLGLILMGVGLWYRHRQRGTAGSNSSMSWTDLEARFKELQRREIRQSHEKQIPGLVDAVTFQANQGGETWRLMGSNREITEEAERLIRIAGAKLRSVKWDLAPRTKMARNDLNRWLYFVAELGEHTRHLRGSSFERGRGHRERRDFWINGIVGESVKGCLECITRESVAT